MKPKLEHKKLTTSQLLTEEFMLDINIKKEIEDSTQDVDVKREVKNQIKEVESSTFELTEETIQFAKTSYERKQVNKLVQTDNHKVTTILPMSENTKNSKHRL